MSKYPNLSVSPEVKWGQVRDQECRFVSAYSMLTAHSRKSLMDYWQQAKSLQTSLLQQTRRPKNLLRLSQAPWNASKGQAWPQGKEHLQYNSLAQTLADSVHGITGRHQQAHCACGQPCHSLFYGHSWCLALLRDPWGAESCSVACNSIWPSSGVTSSSPSPLILCHIK